MAVFCQGCFSMIKEGQQVCPYCGYVKDSLPEEAVYLVPGTRLKGRYIIGKVLGAGGFGVTYIGYDQVLNNRVAVKEFLPGEFATRAAGETQIIVLEGDRGEQFRQGLNRFLDEARRLAKFRDEAGIVRIYDTFEENGTGYIVMEYLEGETLASYLGRNGAMDEETAVAVLTPVMKSLEVVHREGMIHRDIAPDNIFLTLSGGVKLIDFGAARYAATSHSRSLTVIIKQGYSPEEQYRSRNDQGPYTDVYSLAATLYTMLTGTVPPDALERRMMLEKTGRDILRAPGKLNTNISKNCETAILNAMNVQIEDRTQDIPEFLRQLSQENETVLMRGNIGKTNLLRLPLWIKIAVPSVLAVMIALGVLLGTGVISFSDFSQEVKVPKGIVSVPDVEGKTKEEAISALEGAGLIASASGSVLSEFVPAGMIVYQSPAAGSYLNHNGVVTLTVSSGKEITAAKDGIAEVPYLLWGSLEEALEKLGKAGLPAPETEEAYDDQVRVGGIISQSVDFGEKVPEDTVLKLVVSLGPKPFEMPDLAGMTREEAEELIRSLGLSVSVSYENDPDAEDGTVLSQSIQKGESVVRGSSVGITVASENAAEASGEVSEETTAAVETVSTTAAAVPATPAPTAPVATAAPPAPVQTTAAPATPAPPTGSVSDGQYNNGDQVSVDYYPNLPKGVNARGQWILFGSSGPDFGDNTRLSSVNKIGSSWKLPNITGETDSGPLNFLGWYTDPAGGARITSDMVFDKNSPTVLYGHWDMLPPAEINEEITRAEN